MNSGNVPDSFKESPNHLPQKDFGTRWVKKNDVSNYG